MSNNDDLKYTLLNNYLQFTYPSRKLSLEMDFDALEKIKSNDWFHKFEGENIDKQIMLAKITIQHEIIAKIMLYIEDLAIISESLLQGVDHYMLLDKQETPKIIPDVGVTVQNFFKNIEYFSRSDFAKIMSLGDPTYYTTNDEEDQLLERVLEFEKEEYLTMFKILKDFGTQHHPVFRRYKHAGFPIVPGLKLPESVRSESVLGYLKNFEFSSIVPVNKNPFDESIIIPFSDKAIESYRIVIACIQMTLKTILNNKMSEMFQHENLPFIYWNATFQFSTEECKTLKIICERYRKSNPQSNIHVRMDFPAFKKIEWYSNLNNFLENSKKIKRITDEYKQFS